MAHLIPTFFRSIRPGAMTLALLLASLLQPAPALAEDMGDPIAGKTLAQKWCSNCHVLPGGDQAMSTGAPPFSAVAADRQITPMALGVFLRSPHDRMPDLHLSNSEIDDLIAFILASRRS